MVQPKKIVLIETELWPSLLEEALAAKVKVIQVSGRISAKLNKEFVQNFQTKKIWSLRPAGEWFWTQKT